MMPEGQAAKWQPVMLILNRRLECKCGAMAIFVIGRQVKDSAYNQLEDVDVWCQSCFEKAQEEEEA